MAHWWSFRVRIVWIDLCVCSKIDQFLDEGTGLSIYTTTSIPPDAHLISCPFTLAITPKIAVGAIVSLCPNVQDSVKEWNERMVIAVYLTLHWIWADKLGSPSSSYVSSLRLFRRNRYEWDENADLI